MAHKQNPQQIRSDFIIAHMRDNTKAEKNTKVMVVDRGKLNEREACYNNEWMKGFWLVSRNQSDFIENYSIKNKKQLLI